MSLPPSARKGQALALTFAIVFPSVLTLAYFVLLADYPAAAQQSVYTIGKLVQFGFPLAWVFLVLRRRPRFVWPSGRDLAIGLGFGLLVMVAMGVLYFAWLKPAQLLQGLEQQAIEKVEDLGLGSLWKYAALGIFYALLHSLLEEYYWRWFVFGQLRELFPFWTSLIISSLGFMAHHVILLATYFGWDSPLAYLFSLAVAVGGAVWAWMYESSRSLVGPWLSHMLVDAAIFLIGYDLVRALLG